jgi:hypothetical protein
MLRSLVVVLALGVLFAAVAEAKLNPTFSQRTAEPGDTIELDVGEGSALFRGPLRIFLVSLEGSDRDQFKIGELGTPGRFDAPQTLGFEVPDVPAGDYTVAIWFKGSETGTWANTLEGINPLLTIGGADERGASLVRSDRQSGSPLWPTVMTVGGVGVVVVAGAVGWGWRRAARRDARSVSVSYKPRRS